MRMSRTDATKLENIYLEMTSVGVVGPVTSIVTDLGAENVDSYAERDIRIPKGPKKKKGKPEIARRNLSFDSTLDYQTPEVKANIKNIRKK
jgi:hypothetical protein